MRNYQPLLLALLCLFVATEVSAQVSGISYTFSPSADYEFRGKKTGLDDGLMLGGKIGFGFGQFFELRGQYMTSANLETNFTDFGLPNFVDSLQTTREVDLKRYGGEVKANLSNGKLLPFITLGTGVQSIQLGSQETQKQIYLSAGAGIVVSLADRYTLTLEARNTNYRFNTGRHLLTVLDHAEYGTNPADFDSEDHSNWAASASLQLYLGGRRPDKMSELDKAYFSSLTNGVKGLRGTLEPAAGKMFFHDDLPFRDTWMAGVSAGMDFGPYVGIRGFYWQGLEDEKLTEFDKISMYGGEMRMRLNTNTGVVPLLMLGGGKIDIQDEYVGKKVQQDSVSVVYKTDDKGFAMGGLGLNIPLSNNLNVFGSARALLTSGTPVDELDEPSEIQTSMFYSAGVRLSFGQKADDPNALVQNKMDAALAIQQSKNDEEANLLKTQHEARVVELERRLNEAYEEADLEKVESLQKEKELVEGILTELDTREAKRRKAEMEARQSSVIGNETGSVIKMTPAEFESLIEEIKENPNGQVASPVAPVQDNAAVETLQQQEMNRRFSEMEKMLIQMQERQNNAKDSSESSEKVPSDDYNMAMLELLREMNNKLDKQDNELAEQMEKQTKEAKKSRKQQGKWMKQQDKENKRQALIEEPMLDNYIVQDGEPVNPDLPEDSFFRKIKYNGMSAFTGFNLGGSNTWNLGLRWHYGLGEKQKLEFMPEAFFGVGSSAAYGITGNIIVPVSIKQLPAMKPYIGSGFGIMQIEQGSSEKARGAFNIIIGSYVNVGKGRMYIDLTGRNLFRNNQLIAGYRLPF